MSRFTVAAGVLLPWKLARILMGGVIQECSGGPCQVVRIGNIGDIVSGF